jgi:hypothetical protein
MLLSKATYSHGVHILHMCSPIPIIPNVSIFKRKLRKTSVYSTSLIEIGGIPVERFRHRIECPKEFRLVRDYIGLTNKLAGECMSGWLVACVDIVLYMVVS